MGLHGNFLVRVRAGSTLDADDNGVIDACSAACPADIAPPGSPDGQVNIDDLLQVINHWGACPPNPPDCVADVDQNHVVNIDDLLAIIMGWGACP